MMAKIPRRVFGLLLLGATLIGVLDAAQWQVATELRGSPAPLGPSLGSQLLPWVWIGLLMPLPLLASDRWPLDDGRWRRALWPHLLVMLGFVLSHIAGAILLVGIFSTSSVHWPMLTGKLLTYRFPIDALAYWAAVGVTHAARSARTVRERERQAARLEASLAETRLAALRDRLNPHFFFNTLNAINTLALRKDHEGVVRTVESLSSLLRVTLTERRGQETTIGAELEFVDRYLEIEQLRFGDRLRVVREVDPEATDAWVPVMALQPLVENAIRHGVSVKPGPVEVGVRVRAERDRLIVEVSDTGPGFGADRGTNGAGIGLASCRDRLAGLYGGAGRLTCANRPEGGAIVAIELPLRYTRTPLPA